MDFSLWTLFTSAFVSSTLFPGGSEVVLAYLSQQNSHSFLVLLAVATLGNTLGGMSSWAIGWWIARRYPPEHKLKAEHHKAVQRLQRWGSPLLLLSWLPLIGDPLCVAAGWLRMHWLLSLLFIAVGKALRYVVVLAVF